jgi:hypothetical protein
MGQRLGRPIDPIQADEALQIEFEAAGWQTNEIQEFLEAMSLMRRNTPFMKFLERSKTQRLLVWAHE